MAGFLSGLKDLLLGYDKPGAPPIDPASLPPMAEVADAPLTADAAPQHHQGLLSKLGHYVTSPEGMLAIGTTLRAGTGNEDAFADQARIQNSWRVRQKEAEAKADADLKNKAFDRGFVVDPVTGKRGFDNDAYMQAAAELGVKGDRATMLKEAKDLRDKYTTVSTPRGGTLAVNEYDPRDRQTIAAGEPEQQKIKLADGRELTLRRKTDATAAPIAPQADAPAPVVPQADASAPVAEPAPQAAPELVNYRNAIAGVESAGHGDYRATGPVSKKTGDRPYGRYQVMGANIPQWTQETLGRSMTPEEFLASPEAQDAVFDHQFGSYVKKYGSPQEAASMWFTGAPMAQGARRHDQLKTTGAQYVDKFSRGLSAPRQIAAAGPQGADAARAAPAAAPSGEYTPPPGWEVYIPPSPKAEPARPLSPQEFADLQRGGGVVRDPVTGEEKQIVDFQKGANQQRRVPAAVQGGYVANQQAIANIDRAITAVKAHPEAFGLKNFAGSGLTQRLDPNGIDPRSIVANIGSQIIHDRSGAAVTVSETPRLRPFIPQVTDTADKVLKNLIQMRQGYQSNNSEIETTFDPSQGYSPLGQHADNSNAPPPTMLKEGVVTKFVGKGAWMLQNGQPVQVGAGG